MSNQTVNQPPYSPPNSSMAIVSLIAGICGLTIFPFIGSIVAVITGSMAKKEIVNSRGALSGEGLAKAGIILGWIGIGLGVLGFCIAAVAVIIPFILVAFGIARGNSSLFPLLWAMSVM